MPNLDIPIRRPKLDFEREIPRYYLEGNCVKTHFFNALNLLFPDGERFFVKAVHDHLDIVTDPELKKAIRAFAGQEGQHANQHERFFRVLERQGYDVSPNLDSFKRLVKRANEVLPKGLRLSMTAGAEHYTATLASLVLSHNMLEDCAPLMRDLIEWHAIEEIEHKDVAYDVLMAAHPNNYPLRVLGFVLASVVIGTYTYTGMRDLLTEDGRQRRITRKDYEEGRAGMQTGKAKNFRGALRKHLLAYFKPGFHPSQQNDVPLLAEFRPLIEARIAA